MFMNFEPMLIFGFQTRENDILKIFLHPKTDVAGHRLSDVAVDCVDHEKSKQLMDLGIGSCVKLNNIKVILAIDSTHEQQIATYILTENSGIRSITMETRKEELLQPTDHNGADQLSEKQICLPPPQRWTCLTCNCLNYAYKTVCFSCDLPRREGPSGPLWLFKGLYGPPYSYETWECTFCFARKNSHFKNQCWKCDQPRSNKKRRSKIKK